MRQVLACGVCAVVVGLVLSVTAAAAQDETERLVKTVPISAGGILKLKNFSGHVTIVAADRNDVAIEALRKAPRERLNRIKLDIQADGKGVTIEANKRADGSWHENDNVVQTDFDIQVPRKTQLDLSVFSSPVTVTDVDGRLDIHGFSGRVMVSGATGPLKVKTFSGEVHIDLAPGNDRPDIDADTFSGAISVSMQDSAKAGVSISTFSGGITSDLPLTFQSKTKRELKAALNGGGPNTISMKTFSGSVSLKK
jgi:DUF4097 and DUF4098 domain-containing protein YvlB